MAYDSDRARVVLFGGANESKVCEDTWEWDGKKWAQVSLTGPGPRTFPAMAYDVTRKRIVLFGGNRVLFGKTPEENRYLDDTWEWDGQSWKQITVAGPPPRAEAAIAYDSRRRRIVLFGGYNRTSEGIHRLGDTWEWDGARWTELKVKGPSPRNGAAQAYDSSRAKVVLFGGSTEGGPSGETWEWDGKEWQQNSSAVTEARFNCVLAYDAARGMILRFGGRYAGKPVGDTWGYDGRQWRQVSTVGPGARNHTGMVFDAQRKVVVLFGGHDFGLQEDTNVFGDTWEWAEGKWVLRDEGVVKARVENEH